MPITRGNLKIGPCKVTYGAGTFHAREAVKPRFLRSLVPVTTDLFGQIDDVDEDRRIEVPVRLWGAYENLAILFPTSYLNPVVGARIYGNADVPLVLHSRDTERFTLANAQITRIANLHLGVDQPVFAADVVWTGLIKDAANPEDANSYWTVDTAAFADATFAKTNFKQFRWSGAWSGIAGFTTISAQDGWDLEWELALNALNINGLGTVDMTLGGMVARAKCIPVEATQAQMDTASRFQGTSNPLGRLLSSNSADLTLTATGASIVLKAAGIAEHGAVFSSKELRNGEVMWRTTRGFSAGVADAVATVA